MHLANTQISGLTRLNLAEVNQCPTTRSRWLVKDFPVSLREKINHAAYEAKTTVPVWLVNYFNTYGIDGEVINVKPAPAKPRNGGAEGDLNPLLHAVAAVLAASGGKGLGADAGAAFPGQGARCGKPEG